MSHNGQIYSNTNHNFKYAMRRLTGVRAPDKPGLHHKLMNNQDKFIKDHSSFFSRLRTRYAQHFNEYQGADIEALLHAADPHEKRMLRIQAIEELLDSGLIANSRSIWLRSTLWKLKKNEWAKPGKKPRSIGDLGVAASLLGFRLTYFLKTAQCLEEINHNDGTFVFCKSPDPFELERHFRNLIDPPGRFYFLYFSDDSCLSIRNPVTKVVDYYNLDISSCDASHSPALFKGLIDLMPSTQTQADMKKLVLQCSSPLRVVSRANKRHILMLKPTRPMLYSGSTITTGVNNLANLCIGLAISELDYTGFLVNGISEEIVGAAAEAGYILSGCSPLKYPEEIQFLKNSPVLDDTGQWRPLLNFGVYLRACGTCNGDLPLIPGSRDRSLRARAEAFTRGLLACSYPYANSELLTKLRTRAGSGPVLVTREVTDKLFWKVGEVNSKYPIFTFLSSSFCRRYNLTELEYSCLLNDFGSMGFGEAYHGSSVSKILKLDYGLTSTSKDQSKYLNTHTHTLAGCA